MLLIQQYERRGPRPIFRGLRRLNMRWTLAVVVAYAVSVSACSPNSGTTGKATSPPPPPCHPGCFPAGTMIATPAGRKAIETIRVGDAITLVSLEGAEASGAVLSIYQTNNRLVEVRTESGNVVTTETQPFCLRSGGFIPA